MTRSSARRLAPVLLAAALSAAPAAAQTTTVGDGTNPPNQALCPGGDFAHVNSFTVTPAANDRVTGVRMALGPTSAFQLVDRVRILGGTPLVELATIAPNADLSIITFPAMNIAAGTTVPFQIHLRAKTEAAMPAAVSGQALAITAVARSVVSSWSSTTQDKSATLTIDNSPPKEVTWKSVAPAANSVGMTWAGASDAVEFLVARRIGGPVAEHLSDDVVYGASGPLGASAIVYKGATAAHLDAAGVVSGKPHYYRAFSRDACGNWSPGTDLGPVVPSADTTVMLEGDKRPGSLAPVVGILSPNPGTVGAPPGVGFRVKVRIFNPNGDVIANPAIWVDNGTTATSYPLARNPNYGGSATEGGIYEVDPVGSGLVLDAGRYTLRAAATNGYLGSSTVYSARVGVNVVASKGDGNLLVRDNSSQLCSDCHALQTHTSEAVGNEYGSWYVACRGCHTPHGTTNAALVADEIQPPAVNQIVPPSKVQFSKRTGHYEGDAASNPGEASYTNAPNPADPAARRTGVCQVCHTQTKFYRGDGTEPRADHYRTKCSDCHTHTGGFSASGSCTSCHGTKGRVGFAEEAPPVDSCGNTGRDAGNPFNRVGAHQKHLAGTVGCTQCHVNPPIRAEHPGALCSTDPAQRAQLAWGDLARGAVDTWSGPPINLGPSNYDYATQTCSSTYCHGNFRDSGVTSSVSWNSTVACGDCHQLPPLSTHSAADTTCSDCHGAGYSTAGNSGEALATHVDGRLTPSTFSCASCHLTTAAETSSWAYGDGQKSTINEGEWLSRGHGPYFAGVDACLYCHDDGVGHAVGTNPFRIRGVSDAQGLTAPFDAGVNAGNGLCLNCHEGNNGVDPDGAGAGYAREVAAKKISTWHAGGKHGAGNDGGTRCWDCHDPHGDTNLRMIGRDVLRDAADPYGFAGTRAPTAVVFTNRASGADYAKSSAPFDGICNVCHTGTSHYTASSGDGHGASQMCTTCHSHQSGSQAAAFAVPNLACDGCHTSPPNVGKHLAHDQVASVPTAYGQLGSHATQTQYGFGCGKCHGTAGANHMNDVGGTVVDPYRVDVILDGGGTYVPGGTVFQQSGPLNAVFGWTDGAGCSANYCHDPQGTAYASANVTFNQAGALGCASCHDDDTATTLSGKHAKHVDAAGYDVACNRCHAATSSDGVTITDKRRHADGVKDVSFDALNPAGVFAGLSCSSVYCHSNGAPLGGTIAYAASIGWTGTVDATCTSCHGGDATSGTSLATNKHPQHVNQAGVLGANYGCADCHATTVTANRALVSPPSQHVDGAKDVSFAVRGGQASGAYASPSCNSNYCHSSGQATPAYRAVAWNQAGTLGCNGCHGLGNAAGAPDYASGTAGSATANSHAAHTSNGTDATSCQKCHSGFVNAAGTAIVGASHTDGARNVAIAAAYDTNGATSNYTPATKTCNNVSCHGGGSPQWGATMGCTSCHGATVARTPVAGADPNLNAAPPLDTAGASTGVKVGAHVPHVNQLTLRASALACADCHPTPNTHQGTRDAQWSTLATNAGAVTPAPAAGAGAFSTTWEATPTCTNYCHGTGLAAAGGSNKTPSWTGGPSQAACGTCHASPPPVSAVAAEDHPQNAACASCHGTGYATSGLTGTAKNTHLDRTIQKPANGCTACHGVLAGVGGASVPNTSMTAAPGYVGGTTGVDASGASAVSTPSVGAHDAHVRPAGSLNSVLALDCANCHGAKPASLNTTHADGTVALGWSALATGSGTVTPTPAAFNGAWEATPTCTNYCHSNASPAGGGTLSTPTATWTSAANLTCSSCHAMIGRDQAGGTAASLSQKHGKHVNAATYAYTCDECHASTMANDSSSVIGTPANHVNGVKNAQFSTTLKATAINQAAGTYAAGTCASTYCHSGGVATAAPFSATASAALPWTTGTATCRSCHGFDAAAAPTIGVAAGSSFQGSANHMGHVANAGVLGTNYACGDCHANVVAAGTNSPITNFANHVNGTKNVSIANRGTFVSTDTSATCSATYCHSSGQATPVYRTITWAGAAIGCNGCHGLGNAAGSPDYASGAAGSATANSHAKHTANGTDATSCQACHSGFVNAAGTAIVGSSHTDGARNVAIAAAYDTNGATSNYTAATKTCNSVSCHGAGTPQWGAAAISCASCHLGAGDAPNYVYNDGNVARIDSGEWTTRGHGQTSAAFTGAGEFGQAGITDKCVYCHDNQNGSAAHGQSGNPFRLRGAAGSTGLTAAYSSATPAATNAVCLNCHAVGATAYGVDPDAAGSGQPKVGPATLRVDAYHYGADHVAARDGGTRCWDCHDAHGDGSNIKMVASNALRDATDAHGYAGTRVTTNIVFTANAVGGDYVRSASPWTGVCQSCHTATSNWTSTGGGTTHFATTKCTDCHAHQQPPSDAFKGDGDCTLCHNQTQAITAGPLAGGGNVRPDVVGEFGMTWSHKRSGGRTVTKEDCIVCHMEGDAATGGLATVHGDGLINLRDPDTGANIEGAVWGGTGAGSYTSTGSPVTFARFSRNLASATLEPAVTAIMINQCLKCHDADGANHASARVPGGTAEKPFATTITTSAAYTGAGVTANGVTGGVTDINESFKTTNSSYHPVTGKQNNWYARQTRMATPWDVSRTGASANTTSWGALMSCWDCHALPTDSGTITRTVTAHGAAATIRGTATWAGSVTSRPSTTPGGNQVTLCVVCHAGYDTNTGSSHGTGSALSGSTNSGMTGSLRFACNICHSSGFSTAVLRPIRAQDAHGFDRLGVTGTDVMWPRGTTETTKPYAFIRNTQQLSNHNPVSISGTGYTANCNMATSPCSQGSRNYTVGGTY